MSVQGSTGCIPQRLSLYVFQTLRILILMMMMTLTVMHCQCPPPLFVTHSQRIMMSLRWR